MQVPYDTTARLSVPRTFSDEEKLYLVNKFADMCKPAQSDNKKSFDELCAKIPSFCEEIYQIAKDMRWPFDPDPEYEHGALSLTPCEFTIFSVGSNIGFTLIRFFHQKYAAKSEALHKMVCNIIAQEKYARGRMAFIVGVWPKTKKIDGIDIPRLLNSTPTCCTGLAVVEALMKFRDGRFVKEVRELQSRLTNDYWIVNRKRVALYLERYG